MACAVPVEIQRGLHLLEQKFSCCSNTALIGLPGLVSLTEMVGCLEGSSCDPCTCRVCTSILSVCVCVCVCVWDVRG